MNPLALLATYFVLRFLAPVEPDGRAAAAYQVERRTRTGTASYPFAYSKPSSSAPRMVPTARTWDSIWVNVTEDGANAAGWKNGGAAYRVRYQTRAGEWSSWSNVVVVAAAVPDTFFSDVAGRLWWIHSPMGAVATSNPRRRAWADPQRAGSRIVAMWRAMEGDTAVTPGPLVMVR